MEFNEKSPTRVDLAGGTLDCWPLYLFLNDPITVNVAIDIFTYCYLKPRIDGRIRLHSEDLNADKTYDSLAAALSDTETAFELYRAHLRHWRPKDGFDLRTKSESPVGGGLGGSSSLCISMIKAFTKWLKIEMDIYETVRVASHLEAQVLNKPTGTQDYFPPLTGGLCTITYGISGPRVHVDPLPKDLFEGRFLLAYTGKSHHSGINNWQVIKNYLDGDPKPKQALQKLAVIAKDLQQVLKLKRHDALPALFQREYDARTELSDGFSSPEIRELQAVAHRSGAVAKICGAGGGGCVLIWCQDRQADKVATACAKEGFQILPTKPWEP